MAATPRPKGKATTIAYSILGKPPTLDKRSEHDKKLNTRLNFEETVRAR